MTTTGRANGPSRSGRVAAVALLALLGVFCAVASAHVERPAYWPDPAPDCTVTPCAGGAVPHARSLASALNRRRPGATRVVCGKRSMKLLRRSVRRARRRGYFIRPTDHRALSAKRARRL